MKNWLMMSRLKPLLEWSVLTVSALALGLGLAWLPLERSVKDIGVLLIGSALLVWALCVATVAYRTIWSDVNDWDCDWDDDAPPAGLEVRQ